MGGRFGGQSPRRDLQLRRRGSISRAIPHAGSADLTGMVSVAIIHPVFPSHRLMAMARRRDTRATTNRKTRRPGPWLCQISRCASCSKPAFIFGVRNNIHIIDLAQTVPMLHQALKAVSDTVARGGRVLIVGTKRQAQEPVADSARRSAQYFVNSRWLGGMLTNWKTISQSIQRLRKLEGMLSGEAQGLTKKERLTLDREREKLEKALGGIKDMGGIPDLIFVIDTNREAIAIQEARRLNIPVAAILDSNCDPDGITFPIPGNDDAGRAITYYCDLIARAAVDGISRAHGDSGYDLGALESLPEEPALAENVAVD